MRTPPNQASRTSAPDVTATGRRCQKRRAYLLTRLISQGLSLGLLGLMTPACGDDEPRSQAPETAGNTSTGIVTTSTLDYVPSLGVAGLGAGKGPGQNTGEWQPNFGSTNTPSSSGAGSSDKGPDGATDTEAESTETASESASAGAPEPDSASAGASESDSGDTTDTESAGASESDSGDTTDSESKGTTESAGESESDAGSDTQADSATEGDSGDATDSGSGETGGDQTPDPEEVPKIDPKGPQFGLKLKLRLPKPALPDTPSYRAMILEFEVHNSESETPRASPEVSNVRVRPVQPLLRFTAAGKASVVVSTPDKNSLDSVTGQSKPHALAVYMDRNNDGAWSSNESFIAVLPNTLFYEAANSEHPERWRMTKTKNKSGMDRIHDLLSAEIPLVSIPTTLALDRLDAHRPVVSAGGLFESVSERGVDFIALISQAESEDLLNGFWSGHRPADMYLREKNAERWEIQAAGLPAGSRKEIPVLKFPGIKPQFTATNWIVGYRRPVGAPLVDPQSFLTPDSQIVAGVCNSSSPVMGFWMQGGAWASAPEAVLYASWFSLGEGWSFVAANPRNAPFYYYPAISDPSRLAVSKSCLREDL